MAGVPPQGAGSWSVRFSVGWRTVVWLLATVGVPVGGPITVISLYAHPNPGAWESIKAFLGHSVLVVVALGVFAATVADSFTERRSLYRVSWIGGLALFVPLVWLMEVAIKNDFVTKVPPDDWEILKSVILCIVTVLFCTIEKALNWFEAVSE